MERRTLFQNFHTDGDGEDCCGYCHSDGRCGGLIDWISTLIQVPSEVAMSER